MGIYEKLGNVQKKLKAPKSQYNKFGNYNYRSCEDILEAAKPLCIENGLLLTINDSIEVFGERVYVRATATVTDMKDNTQISTNAYAREPLDKKGSDVSQITGAASSYARKYALNGLFCIDDTKDADSTNDHGKGEKSDEQKNKEMQESVDPVYLVAKDGKPTAEQIKKFHSECKRVGATEKGALDYMSVESVDDLTGAQIVTLLNMFQKKASKK